MDKKMEKRITSDLRAQIPPGGFQCKHKNPKKQTKSFQLTSQWRQQKNNDN
jgi:hypothetical protein